MSKNSESPVCQVSYHEGVALITLNRPTKMNALNPELFECLRDSLVVLSADAGVRAIILTGAGEHFSAGGDVERDIRPLQKMTRKKFEAHFDAIVAAYQRLVELEKPIIAALHGYALGAGMDLALACDLRIAGESLKMGEYFVKMGLVPELGMRLLPGLVGPGHARRLCFTGDLVDAQEALRIGLVEQVVPDAELLSTALALAHRLAIGPASIGIMKRAFHELAGLSISESVRRASLHFQFEAAQTKDHAEAVAAFLEKRSPDFRGT